MQSFVNEFQEEQKKFERERKRQQGKQRVLIVSMIAYTEGSPDAAVPPWVGYNEEEQMKAQIMELSAVSTHTHTHTITLTPSHTHTHTHTHKY